MYTRKSFFRLTALLAACAVLCSAAPIMAAQFSADLTITAPDGNYQFALYVKDNAYRLEMEQAGQSMILLARHGEDQAVVLNPQLKQLKEMKGPELAFADPMRAWDGAIQGLEPVAAGRETVNGFECEKFTYTQSGELVFERWVAPQLDHFVKQIMHAANGDAVMELTNIKEGPQDAGLFGVPAGYTEAAAPAAPKEPRVAVPDWIAQVPTSPFTDQPYEKEMSVGDIVRLRVKAGVEVKVAGKNLLDTLSAFAAVPFKNGKPIKNPLMYTMNLSGGQSASITNDKTPAEADEIVVRVSEGKVLIRIGEPPVEKKAVKKATTPATKKSSTPPPQSKAAKKAMGQAIKDNNLAKAGELLEAGFDPNTKLDGFGSTGVMKAASAEMIKLMLTHGADVNLKDGKGESVLWLAAVRVESEEEKTARLGLLLEQGAVAEDIRPSNGLTPLIYFAKKGYLDIVKLLVEHGANVGAKDNKGQTALAEATAKKHATVVEFLKSKGATE